MAWCPGPALLQLQAPCGVGVGQGPETHSAGPLRPTSAHNGPQRQSGPQALLGPGAGAAGRTSPTEPGLMLSSFRVSFIQQILIVRVPRSGPGFRGWDYSSHLTELAGEGETAAVYLTNGETDPEKLSDLRKVTAMLRFEPRPVSCQSTPPPALDSHNYSPCVH